ncbi:MAG: amidohydrolase [Chloroflexi bacterium]|nr:amidohydrolase [Chloroflexota bacterium]
MPRSRFAIWSLRRGHADLLVTNVHAVTLDPRQAGGTAVAVHHGRVLAVGQQEDLEPLITPTTERLDGEGVFLFPGFIDPHVHLLSYAAALRSLDLSEARSIQDIQDRLRVAVRDVPPGEWVRGVGYDDWALAEKRHPTRRDLDAAVLDRPVRIAHRSGHAWVLNSLGLERVGIGLATPEPPGGTIDREVPSGEPSGLLLDLGDYLEKHVPPLSPREIERGLRQVSRNLLSWGVTAVQDATPRQSLSSLRELASYVENGVLGPVISAMVALQAAPDFRAEGVPFGSEVGRVRIGAAKAVLSESSGRLHPAPEELAEGVAEATRAGFQVAVHAVGAEALLEAARALNASSSAPPDPSGKLYNPLRHRIEHASICTPEALELLRQGRLGVVTQPAFLYLSGDRYRDTVSSEDQAWLYRTTAFRRAGLVVASSSDAPVAPPDPRLGLYGAVTRRSRSGAVVGGDRGMPVMEAVILSTHGAADLTFWDKERGSIAPGKWADMVFWDRDITIEGDPAALLQARVLMTMVGGQVVYRS